MRTSNRTGYGFKPYGDKQLGLGGDGGVWTDNEMAAEAARRAAQQQAAVSALAETRARIDAIRADGTLTDQEKLRALRMLTASGYSDEAFRVLRAAQEGDKNTTRF
jgi:hypothetical protein